VLGGYVDAADVGAVAGLHREREAEHTRGEVGLDRPARGQVVRGHRRVERSRVEPVRVGHEAVDLEQAVRPAQRAAGLLTLGVERDDQGAGHGGAVARARDPTAQRPARTGFGVGIAQADGIVAGR
jgi:hypothetical protein